MDSDSKFNWNLLGGCLFVLFLFHTLVAGFLVIFLQLLNRLTGGALEPLIGPIMEFLGSLIGESTYDDVYPPLP